MNLRKRTLTSRKLMCYLNRSASSRQWRGNENIEKVPDFSSCEDWVR